MPAKNTLHITLWLWLIVCPLFTVAQTFRLTQLTTHDGLPIDNVYAAAQDNNGFIWFGTDFGIARYDGNRFTVYDKKNGMANKAVTDIVYAGGDSLIFFSYPSTIQAIHYNGQFNTLVGNTEFGLEQLTKHNLQYYCYKRGSNIYGIWENGKFRKYDADSVFGGTGITVSNITSLNEKGLVFCTNKGLFIKQGPRLVQIFQNQNVQFAIYTRQSGLVVVIDGKLMESDLSFVFKELPTHLPPGFTVYHACEDKTGSLWFRGLDKGVYRLQAGELKEMSEKIKMENKALNEFFPDEAGNLWFCTDGAGILLRKNSACINYETNDGLASNKIFKLLKQYDQLLIGTSNGLSVMKDKKISKIDLPKSGNGLQYTTQLFRVNDQVTGICIERTFSFDDNPGKNESLVKEVRINQRRFNAFKLSFAWQQDENNSWMLKGKILIHLNTGTDTKELFDLSAFKLRKAYCMTGYENKLWLGTDKGIVIIDKGGISFKDSIDNRKTGQVLNFLTDTKNRLWIATEIGLFIYKKNRFIAQATGSTTGSNYCTGLTEDDQGGVWVSTWDGIFVLQDTVKTPYNTNDGLPSKTANCILFDTVYQQLYIGTDNGLAVLKKPFFLNTDSTRRIFISCNLPAFDGRPVGDDSNLSPNENSLNFYLSFPYYQGMNKVIYEYRLDDGQWRNTNNPSINLSDISSGQHRFYARATIDGVPVSKGETVFTFAIKTPFYLAWWFWLPVILLIQFFIFHVINQINKKAKEKKLAVQLQQAEYASLKQQAFTSLMNPHFIFNALNSVQYYVNRQDRLSANKYLSNFATLIRRSFDAAQKSFVTLEEELETIRLYLQLEKMRFVDKFDYIINVSTDTVDEDWMLPSMMLQPFLENAVLHGLMPLGEKGLLTIDVTAENNCLQIVICDNGIGVEKSKALRSGGKHHSKGMQLISERIELLSKLSQEPITLVITTLNPKAQNPGTKITLTIPQEVYEVFQQQRNPS
jgi:ligand-binding sensor domain-containing protein/signal transduction histidine kinase